MPYDVKYGRVSTERGTIGEDEPVIVFRAQDVLSPAVLKRYRDLCRDAGTLPRHLELVSEAITRFEDWQREHPDQVKYPDSV